MRSMNNFPTTRCRDFKRNLRKLVCMIPIFPSKPNNLFSSSNKVSIASRHRSTGRGSDSVGGTDGIEVARVQSVAAGGNGGGDLVSPFSAVRPMDETL